MFKLKSALAMLLSFILVFSIQTNTVISSSSSDRKIDNQISVMINGMEVTQNLNVIVRDNVFYLPAKETLNHLGINLLWDKATSSMIFIHGDKVSINGVGTKLVNINGNSTLLNSKSILENGKSYIPLEFLTSIFGATTESSFSSVSIHKEKEQISEYLLNLNEALDASAYTHRT